jgi:uncharacterized protein YaiI (UPF0178 family)
VRWLVDAMNVIGSRPDGWWKDRDAAVGTLIEEVDRWAARGDDEVVVVLERRPPSPIPTAVVEVAHADRSGPDAADDEIVRILRETSGGGPTTVVTSDRRLAARAKAAGAEVEPAGGFRRRLDGEGGEAPSA